MTAKFQLVIDCADPEPLARFWVAALGYEFEPPPDGYDNWDDYWRAVGVREDELGLGLDCIVDPAGRGPRIWFQVVPEKKTLKNRLHLDITVSGGRANPIQTRRRLVDAEAQRLEALGATVVRVLYEDGVDHYGVAMRDPEGNEFDINLGRLARRPSRRPNTARASPSLARACRKLIGRWHAKQIICAPGSRNLRAARHENNRRYGAFLGRFAASWSSFMVA
jgi:Glyoxalase-like domain